MATPQQALLAFFGLPGGLEWIVIGIVGLLIFGRRLPDVARSVGKSIVEFKKGLHEAKAEIDLSDAGVDRILPDNRERLANPNRQTNETQRAEAEPVPDDVNAGDANRANAGP